MDRAGMVAWLREYAPKGDFYPAVADELERLGKIEAEHQGCALPDDLGGLPYLVKQWLANHEGKTFRDCGAAAAVCKVLRDHERLVREHQGCTENMASLVRDRDEALAQLDRIEGFNREKQQGHGRAMSIVDALKSELLTVDLQKTKALKERNEARDQRDAAYRALDELRAWVMSQNEEDIDAAWPLMERLDALDPRTQEANP